MKTLNPRLHQLVIDNDGVFSRLQVVQANAVRALERAQQSQRLTAIWPGVYSMAQQHTDLTTQQLHRAALTYVGEDAALSHISALEVHGLQLDDLLTSTDLHLTVPATRCVATQQGLHIHRQAGFRLDRDATTRGGIVVVRPEVALVQSWDWLQRQRSRRKRQRGGGVERAALIASVQQRLTTVKRVEQVVSRSPSVCGRAQLRGLLDLLKQGCHSELELMGYQRLFQVAGMPRSYGQVRVDPAQLGVAGWSGGPLFLDRLFLEAMVDAELDGRRWHSGERQDHDHARDAALLALGIMVMRFSYQQVAQETEHTLRLLRETLALRQRQLEAHPLPFRIAVIDGQPHLVPT